MSKYTHDGAEERGYLGNPKLKRIAEKIKYQKDQIRELLKCSKDPVYFIKKYVKVVHVDRGFVPFKLYPYQQELVTKMHENRFVIGMMPRQSGKSTTVAAYFLWCILFNTDYVIGILANKDKLARDILARIKRAYESLPKWLQQGVVAWNKGNIELENGSKIIAAATSSDSIRGFTFSCLLLDEFAHVQRNVQDEFFTSVYPTISSGATTKTFIISTPKGMDLFYKLWHDANARPKPRNLFIPFQVHWREVPGRDEEWKRKEIANIGEDKFRQEYETMFLGSTNTLIHPRFLSQMPMMTPLEVGLHNRFKVYERPIPGHSYVLTCDAAHGKGLDYSVFSVFDTTAIPYKMVAIYRDNQTPPGLLPQLINSVGKSYNEAIVLLEVNDVGYQVAELLHIDCEYPNMLSVVVRGRAGQEVGGGFSGTRSTQRGLRMTAAAKRIGCANLKPLIEEKKLIVPDFDTISELTTFVNDDNTYNAEPGCHDDTVMTLVLFAWLAGQKYFKDLTGHYFQKVFSEQMAALEDENIMPFGFIVDGLGDDLYTEVADGMIWESKVPFGEDVRKTDNWLTDSARY